MKAYRDDATQHFQRENLDVRNVMSGALKARSDHDKYYLKSPDRRKQLGSLSEQL